MSCLRVILAVIFPPLAVYDRGCGFVSFFLMDKGVFNRCYLLNDLTQMFGNCR